VSAIIDVARVSTILYCTAWTQAVDFYRDTLCFEVTYENDWFVEFALGDGSHISIANAARATIAATGGSGVTLSWQVPDVGRAHRILNERGVQPGAIHQSWGAAAFHFRDPEGHRIELWATPNGS
jgi:catechol 2,3-dioxygenase-like lactoylglutathione lyase family enzyme